MTKTFCNREERRLAQFPMFGCIYLFSMISLQVRTSFTAPYNSPVVGVSPVLQSVNGMDKDTCGDVCRFDDWYQRAHCEGRGLNYVPYSYGCEGAVMLELQNNQISQLTRSCTLGYDLVKTLDLSRNELTIIENGTFMNMNSLQNILLSNNFLKVVENFTFMGTEESLKRIYLNHNKIKTIHKDAFRSLIKVTSLYLSYNKIEFLHESTFCDMHSLRHLYLSDNSLHYLARNTFKDLTHLKTITLSKNNFKSIPRGLFAGLTSLTEITLAGNQLVTIPPPKYLGINMKLELLNFRNNNFNTTGEILPYLNVSDQLLLGGNPFICDCTFKNIREWYQNKSRTEHEYQYDQIGCFRNESFTSITDDFPVRCEGNRVGHFPLKGPTQFVAPTSWTSQKQVLFTSTKALGTTSPPLSKEYDRWVVSNQTLERRQRILSVYCVAMLTLFFSLWVVKTLIFLFKGK